MTCSNSVNLEQLDGGTVIKQGDVSSRFEYRLLDENNEVIPLAGREAKISIGKSGYLYFETRTTVSETNTVSFTITSVLPVGTHRVEVTCEGYVFPSDKSTTITVKKSHEEYAVAGALDKVYYDDTELREGLSEVSSKVAEQADDIASVKTSVGDIQEEYDSRLRTLETKEDFDDSALKAKDSEQDGRLSTLEEATAQVPELRSNLTSEKEARLEALAAVDSRLQVLEAKPDFDDSELKAKDVEQDGRLQSLEDKTASLDSLRDGLSQNKIDLAEFKMTQSATNSELVGRLDILEAKPDFDPSPLEAKDRTLEERLSSLHNYDDSDIKRRLVAVEQLLIPKRCPPTGAFILDKMTKPWTIWLDNGSGLQLPDYDKGATIYGDGYAKSLTDNDVPQWPLVYQVVKLARGSINLSHFKASDGCWTYWSPTTHVINPVCRRSDYDWSKAKLMSSDSAYGDRQQYLIRTMYELGLFSAKEVESLGAIKQN